MSKLKGKNVVVTGGGSGIGEAVSLLFAEEGANIHIVDLNKEQGDAVVKRIVENGGNAELHICSVSHQADVMQLVSQIEKIDILVNNAGIAHVGNVENCAERDFTNLFDVNVRGVYNMLYAAIPTMKQHGGGVILNLASIAALVGIPDRFAYSMTKGAVYAMTLSIARDYLKDNIRCNSISPARVHTPFVDGFVAKNYPGKEEEMLATLAASQPIGRMAKPAEIAKLALFLCSDDSAFITGNDYPIDGGFIKLNN